MHRGGEETGMLRKILVAWLRRTEILRHEQHQGAKDRCTLVLPRLLAALRTHLRNTPQSLLPLPAGKCPSQIQTAHRLYSAAGNSAGIAAEGGLYGLSMASPRIPALPCCRK